MQVLANGSYALIAIGSRNAPGGVKSGNRRKLGGITETPSPGFGVLLDGVASQTPFYKMCGVELIRLLGGDRLPCQKTSCQALRNGGLTFFCFLLDIFPSCGILRA